MFETEATSGLPDARARCAARQMMSEARGEPPGLSIRNTMASMSGSPAASSRALLTPSEESTRSPMGVVVPLPITTVPLP